MLRMGEKQGRLLLWMMGMLVLSPIQPETIAHRLNNNEDLSEEG